MWLDSRLVKSSIDGSLQSVEFTLHTHGEVIRATGLPFAQVEDEAISVVEPYSKICCAVGVMLAAPKLIYSQMSPGEVEAV